jgi:hypothetical protein
MENPMLNRALWTTLVRYAMLPLNDVAENRQQQGA